MKKELSPALVIGGIVGLLAVVGLVFFLISRSDPASQAPNPPPTFDASAKERQNNAPPGDRTPTMRR